VTNETSSPANLYGKDYYDCHLGPIPYDRNQPHWNNFFKRLANTIIERFHPAHVMDIGCAKGFLVEHLRDRGVEAYGIDISPYAISEVRPDIKPYCRVASVTEPLQGHYDLITCIEVAEHVTEEEGRQMIKNICQHTDQVIFSSTPDDFTEPTHINVQPAHYWQALFAEHGFYPDIHFEPYFIALHAIRFRCIKKEVKQYNEQPLVSICIPTYNGEYFISGALCSALSQTYLPIEIIVSDDNSKDKTIEVVKLFSQKYPSNFFIFTHEQYGLVNNCNFCISQARGKYIKFLFQDDLLEQNCLEEMVNLAEQDAELGLIFSPRGTFLAREAYSDPTCQAIYYESKDTYKFWSDLQPIQPGRELLADPNLLDNPINKIGEPSTVLIKKEVFERVGLFDPKFCQVIDIEMWFRVMSQYKIGFVEQSLSHFRIHPQQQTRRNAFAKEAIVSDYQNFYYKIYESTQYAQNVRQQALCKYAVLSKQYSALQQVRKQVADQWLSLPVNQLESMYLSTLGKTHQTILSTGIKEEILTDTEETFVEELIAHISKGFDQPKIINYLLAAMLYCSADQLPLQYDLPRIPKWFINDYLKFMFYSPPYFKKVSDADSYYHYMQRWIDYLHTSIFNHLDSAFWRDVATQFLQLANFIPVYFNNFNLKDIYVKRAEILEFALKLTGHQIDYEFTDRPLRRKIRLGILAVHFTPTAETFASLPVYEYISRDFEVILYSLTSSGHRLEQYCQSCANSFKLLPNNLIDQVNFIRADDLDILFIATNVTARSNQICLLSLHRLARVQATSVASIVTTGMQSIDYYISGNLTEPYEDAEQHYQEKLLKIDGPAHCFSYGSEQNTATIKVDRESLNISKEAVVFVSVANLFKITPELSDSWAKIIASTPNSVLMLFPYGPNWSSNYAKEPFQERMVTTFSMYGVEKDRLLILDPAPVPNRDDIKEYLKLADVYLDSYPFSGTTSLIEPLEVGLPIVSKQGTTFRSSMGSALLQELDVPDLVADSEESYIKLAIALGTNPELRKQKSDQIKQRMQANPRFLDSRSYSARMGALFQELFRKHQAIALTDSLKLRDINLIIFPDWSQSEDILYQDIASVITSLVNHPDKNQMTLLIDTGNVSEDEANLFLSDVVMNLLLEEDLDVTDGLEISLVGQLGEMQWEALLPHIQARIVLEKENQGAKPLGSISSYAALKLENISVRLGDSGRSW
jgi:predicted O-linked N-acetylglucosamine transferase (SPINDLY family)